MRNKDADFDSWFSALVINLEEVGISFSDEDSVRQDYDDGKSMWDVLDEIKAELG